MHQVRIIAKNFVDMVALLPAIKLDNLYANAFICEAILRFFKVKLDDNGVGLCLLWRRKYVLQICVDGTMSAKWMKEWVLADGAFKHKVAFDRLLQLRIFTETVDSEVLPREPLPSSITGRLPSLEKLDVFAIEQWELIHSSQAERPLNISSPTMKVFQRGLLTLRDKEAPRLTESGFQFLLMDTNAQVWYIIREYISNSEDKGVDPADLISFLLELSFHATGEAYNIHPLTEVQRETIKDLADLGLVKLQQCRKECWFIPTKLATNLSMSLTDLSSRKQGFVAVETDFRMIEYQLPNLIVGVITKMLLKTALLLSRHIISFLQQHAHPRVAERIPSVPKNVTDQIRLWEADLNRVEMTPAHHCDEFPSREVFEGACDFARECNCLLWEDSEGDAYGSQGRNLQENAGIP